MHFMGVQEQLILTPVMEYLQLVDLLFKIVLGRLPLLLETT